MTTSQPDPRSPRFATTRWSVVARAGADDSEARRAALQELCQRYWYPVFAFIRRDVRNADDASDHTQAFFARLLERGDIAAADADRGRFRTFLLACVRNHMHNRRDHERALKRGGDQVIESLDALTAERRYAEEPSVEDDPARGFAAAWANVVLENVITRLRERYAKNDQEDLFDALRTQLTAGDDTSYKQLAERLDTTEGAIKTAVHRLRSRFRDTLRDAVAETVDDPDDTDAELQELLTSLRP